MSHSSSHREVLVRGAVHTEVGTAAQVLRGTKGLFSQLRRVVGLKPSHSVHAPYHFFLLSVDVTHF